MTADDVGFEEFYRQWMPQLRRFLTWLEPDSSTIEDAAQETMLSALRYWPTLRQKEHPRTWLFMVARQRLSDERDRRRAHALRGEIEDTSTVENTTAGPESVDNRLAIVGYVRKLPSHHVLPVVLHFYGFSDREIAQIAGIAPSSARSYRSLALRTLNGLVDHGSKGDQPCDD